MAHRHKVQDRCPYLNDFNMDRKNNKRKGITQLNGSATARKDGNNM